MHIDKRQTCPYIDKGTVKLFHLPAPSQQIIKGIKWGRCDQTFTPAFWKAQTLIRPCGSIEYKWGNSLKDEIVACILGGYGITAEMSEAAFRALKSNQALSVTGATDLCGYNRIVKTLTNKIDVNGKSVHYRFARQRAKRIFLALVKLQTETAPANDIAFRDWILSFNGIGAKTASWITRNWFGSDNVAIIDIHVFRACTIMGLFKGNEIPSRDYAKLESKLVSFARAMNVKLSEMDVIIWDQMRNMKDYAIASFNQAISHRHIC